MKTQKKKKEHRNEKIKRDTEDIPTNEIWRKDEMGGGGTKGCMRDQATLQFNFTIDRYIINPLFRRKCQPKCLSNILTINISVTYYRIQQYPVNAI